MGVFIPRNSRIPIIVNRISTTTSDNQCSGRVAIYEGESATAADNYFLGELILDDFPPCPQGVNRINISFDIDDNGILSVSAEENSTRQRKRIRINSDGRATCEGIEKVM
ncbi:hypothetical protein CerSpe_089500 [Prunus speciosa]